MYLAICPASFFADVLNRAIVWGSSALNHLCAVTSVCDGVVCGEVPQRPAGGRWVVLVTHKNTVALNT